MDQFRKSQPCAADITACVIREGVERSLVLFPEMEGQRHLLERLHEASSQLDQLEEKVRQAQATLDEIDGQLVNVLRCATQS